jgi:tetratricopeptide (TPR) repeat protein
MKTLSKLKDDARGHELREEWDKAISVYLEVIRTTEEGEAEIELWLYNRVGDLYIRTGRPQEGLKFYEQGADRYAEAGLYNNAIALCNKALRYASDRPGLLQRLGQFSAAQGFLTDARHWFLEYARVFSRQGNVDAAIAALEEYAALVPDAEVRELLARQLLQAGQTDRGLVELRRSYGMYRQAGDAAKAAAVRDELLALAPEAGDPALEDAANVTIDTAPIIEPEWGNVDAGLDIEQGYPGVGDSADSDAGAAAEQPADRVELLSEEDALPVEDALAIADALSGDPLPMENVPSESSPEAPELPLEPVGGLETMEFESPVHDDFARLDGIELEYDEDEFDPLPLLGDEADLAVKAGVELEVAHFPEDALQGAEIDREQATEAWIAMARQLAAAGDVDAALAELDALHEALAEEARYGEAQWAIRVALEFAPSSMTRRRRLVEYATAGGEAAELIRAYVELAIALESAGIRAMAEPVYERVLEMDPDNLEARAGLDRLAPRAATPEPEEPVDADAWPEPEAAAGFDAWDREDLQAEGDAKLEAEQEILGDAWSEAALQAEADAWARAALRTEVPHAADAASGPAEADDPNDSEANPDHGDEGFINLRDLILTEERKGTDDTRMVVAETEPTGDEDHDFAELLSLFKARVAETLDGEDVVAHYDLGLAFKEMGLYDEAIGEFQLVLRAGQPPLSIYEELGQCFLEKARPGIAVKILEQGIRQPADDLDRIGMFYYLGRAHQDLGQREAALDAFERVIALDVGFADAMARVANL